MSVNFSIPLFLTVLRNRLKFKHTWREKEYFLSKVTKRLNWLDDCKYMKFIYVNCGQRKEYGSDLRCNDHYLSSTENMARKKFRLTRYQWSKLGTKLPWVQNNWSPSKWPRWQANASDYVAICISFKSDKSVRILTAPVRFEQDINYSGSLLITNLFLGSFIPFRDSKLTRILQSSLGGNAKTSMLCTITPAAIEESISTLKVTARLLM